MVLIEIDNRQQATVKMVTVHEKMQTLIQEDRYNDALKFSRVNKDAVSPIHLAYIYYKLGMDDIVSLKSAFDSHSDSKSARTYNHILGQYFYKIGASAKALDIYNKLIESSVNNAQFKSDLVDLSVNQRAVYAQLLLENADATCKLVSTAATTYDQLFNDAFVQIVNGELDDALETLEKALTLAQETLHGDADIDDEINPIKVQQAYVYLLKGDFESSKQYLDDALTNGANSNKALELIINNNKVALSNEINYPHLLFRELGLPNSYALSKEKLTVPQVEILSRNLTELKKAISPKSKSEGLQLVQEKVLVGNLQGGIQILEKMDTNIPAIGATLIALYELEGCMNKLKLLLQSITTENKEYSKLIELKKLTVNLNSKLDTSKPSEEKIKSLVADIDISDFSIDELMNAKKNAFKGIGKSNNKKNDKKKNDARVKVIKETPLHWLPKKERPDYKPKKKTLTQGSA